MCSSNWDFFSASPAEHFTGVCTLDKGRSGSDRAANGVNYCCGLKETRCLTGGTVCLCKTPLGQSQMVPRENDDPLRTYEKTGQQESPFALSNYASPDRTWSELTSWASINTELWNRGLTVTRRHLSCRFCVHITEKSSLWGEHAASVNSAHMWAQ